MIPKITSANLCKPIHNIINYSTSILSFLIWEVWKGREKISKFKYLENEKSFLDEIRHFLQFLNGYHLVKKYKFDKKQGTQALIVVFSNLICRG